MPTRKKTETLVGLFLFIGLALLAGLILAFGNIGQLFKGRYDLTVDFKEAPGIIKGSTVRMRGAKIGLVTGKPVLTSDGMIRVPLAIEEQFQIRENSVFQIAQSSLIGDKEIQVTPPSGPGTDFIEPGSCLAGGGPSGLDLLQNEAEQIALDGRALIQEARETLAGLDQSLVEIRLATTQLASGLQTINQKVLSDENLANLGRTLGNFERTSARFAKVSTEFDPTVSEFRGAIREVKEAATSAKLAINQVEPALGNVPLVLSSIERTADKATAAIDKLDKGKGALNTVVADQQFNKDLKSFVRNLKEKGILGYKDEEEKKKDPRDRFQGRRR